MVRVVGSMTVGFDFGLWGCGPMVVGRGSWSDGCGWW